MTSHLTRGICCWSAILMALLLPATARPQALLLGDQATYKIHGSAMELLEDPSGKLDFPAAQQQYQDGAFSAGRSSTPNFGITDSAIWVRFEVTNNSTSITTWHLRYYWPLTSRIDFYVVHPHLTAVHRGGLEIPASRKYGPNHIHVTPVSVPIGETRSIFIRVASPATIVIDLSLWRPAHLQRFETNMQGLQGLYYGVIIALILCNLLFFATLRRSQHLYYSLFMMSYLTYHMSFFGFTANHVWPEAPWVSMYTLLVSCSFAISTGLFFTRSFLETARHTPRLDRLLTTLAVISVVALVLVPIKYMLANMVLGTLTLTAFILVIATVFLIRLKDATQARFFLAAWSIMVLGGILFGMLAMGTLPINIITINTVHFGAALGGVILAFALGHEVTKMTGHYRRMLEQKVAAHTTLLRTNVGHLNDEVQTRRHIERNLRDSVSRLEGINAELSQFANVTSKDLTHPLTSAVEDLDILYDQASPHLDSKGQLFIEYARDGARRMLHLIDDLLAYARTGSRHTRHEPVDLAVLVNQAIADLDASVRTSDARFEIGELPVVNGDASLLQQLLLNLLGNALKFHSHNQPIIRITADRQAGEWLITIEDNGIGFDARFAQRIFGIFQRLHTQDEYKGTGLGLAVCKKVVERHRGRIWAELVPSGGSRFKFTLPE
jgi:signal transduction histidine kinase